MKNVVMSGQQGVFFTKEEYEELCSKIVRNNELIRSLQQNEGDVL